ncbi:MAG TPA: hypothetical protein VGF91_18855 [Solirubrobacteraceae bacterium]|jgi:hypothetical protein
MCDFYRTGHHPRDPSRSRMKIRARIGKSATPATPATLAATARELGATLYELTMKELAADPGAPPA